jgi:hypothetical protein
MPLLTASSIGSNVPRAASNMIALASGQSTLLGPEAGVYLITVNKYHTLQNYDPITTTWRSVGSSNEGSFVETVYSDGNNYRVANQSGCPIGALLTNAGSGYTSAPTVTPSAGASIWKAVVGGAVSTSVTVTNGGVNYTYPPTVILSSPSNLGIPATAVCALTNGVVSSVTIIDQGAGYSQPPIITFVNDPREGLNNVPYGYGASAVATLTGAGTVTAVLMIDHGQGNQATLPTLAFSGGGGSSAAATVIMNWAITAYAVGTAGAGLAGSFAEVTAMDNYPSTAPAYTNPSLYNSLVSTRQATIRAAITAGALQAGGTIFDGGCYTSSPIPLVIPSASSVTTAPVVTFTLGGQSGASYIMPI